MAQYLSHSRYSVKCFTLLQVLRPHLVAICLHLSSRMRTLLGFSPQLHVAPEADLSTDMGWILTGLSW